MKVTFLIACSLLTVYTIFFPAKKYDTDTITSQGLVFQSHDVGKNWKDISQGLSKDVVVQCFDIINNNIMIGTDKGIFTKQNKSTWQKDPLMNENIQSFNKVGNAFYGLSYQSGVFQLSPHISNWLAAYSTLPSKYIRFLHETQNGAVIAGGDLGLYRSLDKGLSWVHIYQDIFVHGITEVNGSLIVNTADSPIISTDNGSTWGKIPQYSWIGDIIDINGALIGSTESGIVKSVDNGASWQVDFDKYGPAYHIQKFGNRLVLTSNGQPVQKNMVGPQSEKVCKLHYSDDNGATWQSMDPQLSISKPLKDIVQYGNYIFCSHSDGLSRSSDWGKTWELVLPATDKMVYELYVKDNSLFCYKVSEGC
jgi:photosystem II stability/assembly factor-like uncharacterized protein